MRSLNLFVGLLALIALVPGWAGTQTPSQPIAPVQVDGGAIGGRVENGVATFFGMPFAAPPVGALRWRPPQPVAAWTGTRPARAFSPACRQTVTWITGPQSEDCLYLNVWAPAGAKGLPVMVWIHGGGLFGGTGAQPLYDGRRLAKQGVILVTLNYRLGVLGFFSHPELTAESPDKASGDQGVLDQIAALKWVQRNIAAFGGDPGRVTIFGESAGSESVAVLVASPLAHELFQRAIAESGNDAMPLIPQEDALFDRKAAEAQGAAFAKALGAAHLDDLRAMDADTLIRQPWTPATFVDGHVLREDLTTTYRHHRQNDVSLLVGWNADEGRDLAPEIFGTSDFTVANYQGLIAHQLGRQPSPQLLAAYPAHTDAEAKAAMNQFTTDYWGWRMWTWAGLQAADGAHHAYVYYFVHSPAAPRTPCTYGCKAGHGAEIRYAFDNLGGDPRDWTADDLRLSTEISHYWTNFAKIGDPNGDASRPWRPFDGSDPTVMRLGTDAEVRERGALPALSLFAAP